MITSDSSAKAPPPAPARPVAAMPSGGPLPPPPPAPPRIPPSVSIDSIAAPAFPGPVTIAGSSDPGTNWLWNPADSTWDPVPAVTYTGVSVSLDTGEVAAATSADQWASWTASVTLNHAGVHVATAIASTTTSRVVGSSKAKFVAGVPTLAVSAPAAQNPPVSIRLAETGADVTVMATTTAAAWFGGLMVTAQCGQSSVGLAATDPAQTSWQGVLHLDPMPLGNRPITVVAAAAAAPQASSTVVSIVNAVDAAPPHLAVTHPAAGAKVVPDASMAVLLTGTCADAQSGVSGGAASVGVSMSSNGPFVAVVPGAPGNFSQWSATVTAPALGPFTVYLRASDAAGNTTGVLPWPLDAVSAYVPASLADRLSDTEYLAALMAFASDVVSRPGGQVTSADLRSALQQPVDRMSQPLSAAAIAGQVPVNELRIPAEFLRARIAASGISQDPGRQGEAGYLQTAYETLLSAAGTSYAEMRLARGADDATRQALAARLGIPLYGPSSSQPRQDQLDALTLDGPALTESALETLFGLPATTAGLDPFRTIQPQVLGWRIETQRSRWQSGDAAPPSPVAYSVIADPDIITTADIVPGAPQSAHVSGLLQARSQQLAGQAATLGSIVGANSGNDTAQLAALLSQGIPGVDIASLHAQDLQGMDISGQLAAAGLNRAGFAYLVQLLALAGTGLISATEWSAAVDVLVGAFRRRQYATWAAQETGILLSPDTFQLTGAGPAVGSYRIDPRARADWQATLRTRIIGRQSLIDGMNGLVATTEQVSLGMLRDALLLDVAGPNGSTDAAATQLATQYQVDFAASGSLSTTRLAQATASLQSLLLLIRSGDNTTVTGSTISGWSLTKDEATFDAAWAWMGTAGSWRSATTTFLFAEAAIDPSLLQESPDGSSPSQAFQDLCRALAVIGPPDTSASGPVAAYQASVTTTLQTIGAMGKGDRLIYLSDRSAAHQLTLKTWCGAVTSGGDTGLAREVFWGVPMLVGQRLHADGHHQAALDWLWVAYPYNAVAPVSSFDLINTELATTTPVPADLTFPPGWTADLNPFHLIRTGQAPYPYRPYSWIRNTVLAIITCLTDYADSEYGVCTAESLGNARNLYATAARLLAHPSLTPIQPSSAGEPALPIPQLQTLTTRVTTQLAKLRQGRDIAGLPRTQAVTTGDPVSQPTPYHFKVLLARAQQLTQQAATIEAGYLSALEKYDSKTLQLSDAQNAANVAGLQLTVHSDRVQEATDAITAAGAQQTKATTMSAQYQDAIDAPPNQYETSLLSHYRDMRTAQDVIAGADAAIGIAQSVASAASLSNEVFSFGAQVAIGATEVVGYVAKGAAQMWLNNLQAQAQADQLQASIEDRKQQWRIQKASADQDALIAAAQLTTANDQKTIAVAEQAVATAQSQQAVATLQLLTTAFTNPDLYKWMSDTLGGVYRYFLRQATAAARLAQAQLAFERAEPEQRFVRTDYWQPPLQLAASAPADTRGMTGAEQLAADLAQLDQYAFSTDTRRLNLSQTFSLAQLLPADFLGFRSTGQISFATPMRWFDQDFPGLYQRLIRQVSVSVVALVPPTRGIRATLSSSGISRVIAANNGTFSEVTLRRDPPAIAFTSPMNATGVFQADLQPDMLLPFESSGVDTTWRFTLPPAANPFDFSGVSDVLITIDYTALADPGYQAQVIRSLNADLTRSSDCVFSLAWDFPDQWYALNNPAPGDVNREATLTLVNASFPPAISPASLATTQIAIRLSSSGPLAPVPVTLSHGAATGAATTDSGGIASTRRGAGTWNALTGTSPAGDWTLSFDASAGPLFRQGLLDDVLLIVSWTGQAPAWPA